MNTSSDPARAAGKEARVRTRPDRRRHGRCPVQAPVTLRYDGKTLNGFTRNLSYSGALVQTTDELPPAGVECEFTLEFLHGEVEGRGRVTRVDEEGRAFALDLAHIDRNGELLLVVLLMAGTGSAAG
jgi:hypothetical protein